MSPLSVRLPWLRCAVFAVILLLAAEAASAQSPLVVPAPADLTSSELVTAMKCQRHGYRFMARIGPSFIMCATTAEALKSNKLKPIEISVFLRKASR